MFKNRRSEAFKNATRTVSAASRWTDVASDPNEPSVVARRALTLRDAWRPAIADRDSFFVERCAGRRVLDIGCVAHDAARMEDPRWLHGQLAKAASACVGVDVIEAGVAQMVAGGYNVVVHDLSSGVEPLREFGPFDVVAAGELLEHLPSTDMIFSAAQQLLTQNGELLLSSPNPYAPKRVRAGQRGIVWENVDHVLYAFPSGVAELAERNGLRLVEAMTTTDARDGRSATRRLAQWYHGSAWRLLGLDTTRNLRVKPIRRTWSETMMRLVPTRRQFLGETFVYVVKRAEGSTET